ncbi:DUF1176 domain-containing protein [Terrarubrum flagellatum]|uniref:DUF1176 domain-containing protein n=1 Tax=Terrirubrum flagellatum TaxID=2895980 RepID=UPI003144EA23
MKRTAHIWGASLLLGLLAFAPAAFAQGAKAPAYKTFKDWEVGCDNVRGCVALGFSTGDGDGGYIRVALAAGPDAKPEWKIVAGEQELSEPKLVAPPAEPGLTGWAAILAAARKVDRVTVSDGKGARKIDLSFLGASAALLFIDDMQGRVGTTTALARPGPKPASSVPAAPPLPVVKAKPTSAAGEAPANLAAALVKRLPASVKRDCSRMKGDDDSGEAYAMGDGVALVMLPCDAGAYNFSSLLWLVKGKNVAGAQKLMLPDPLGRSQDGVTNGDYDPASGQLSFLAKGRGIGDCGESGVYSWTGSSFVLASYRKMDKCQAVDPDDWPVLWRSAE